MATNSTVIVEKSPTTNVVTTVTQSSSALSQFKGIPGKSAYQLALDSGFVGTFNEWIESLKGEQGIQGIRGEKGEKGDRGIQGIQGLRGIQGERGLTGLQGLTGDKGDKGDKGASFNYEWADTFLGVKTSEEAEFVFTNLKGDQGDSAYEVALNNGFVGSQLEWLDSLKINLMINPSVKNHLFSNNGVDPIWVSIEDKLNSEEVNWDLGEL